MTAHQAAMWIDHQEARIFRVEAGKFDESTVAAPTKHLHRHAKSGTDEHNHPDDSHHFFKDVSKALEALEIEQLLVVGPSTAKLQFLRYTHREAHALEAKIVGIETVDHPSDRQLVSLARRYFKIADRVI